MDRKTQSLAPISSPVSMEKFAYNAIKEAILTFRFLPGENLVEATLAMQLNTSKTPVRDALTHLVREGFIEKVPFKGYYVTQISRQDMIELFEIRAALEGLVTRHAVSKITPGILAQLQALVDEHTRASEENDDILASRTNTEFHELLIAWGGSERIIAILTNLDEHLQRYRVLSYVSAGRLQKSAREHEEIMRAIKNGDAHGAELATRNHLLSVSSDLAQQDFDLLIRKIGEPQSVER